MAQLVNVLDSQAESINGGNGWRPSVSARGKYALAIGRIGEINLDASTRTNNGEIKVIATKGGSISFGDGAFVGVAM